jgi:hypothetical protein
MDGRQALGVRSGADGDRPVPPLIEYPSAAKTAPGSVEKVLEMIQARANAAGK